MVYNEELINKLKDLLVKRGETVAVAKSVTLGNIQAAISLATDAKEFFSWRHYYL